MSETYDPDTTTLFDEDPDLVRLRRHVADTGNTEIGSPVGAYIKTSRFEHSVSSGIDVSADADITLDAGAINVALFHRAGY
jgi:hypothetical protein